ncbi:hypothetical protein CV093_16920 [Oceanobacillus sp. 143]|uniref:hypothetical protein n=1 Tax=Oceanobacillus zhaokaii TaxID=2052660 RepID=UPI0013161B8C|nr:hypothetical protein [Oceanobacillus zhaokaii]QGS69365.1 hypothetical protein CV093_16920 [Oceanobacillus sp. 143]
MSDQERFTRILTSVIEETESNKMQTAEEVIQFLVNEIKSFIVLEEKLEFVGK